MIGLGIAIPIISTRPKDTGQAAALAQVLPSADWDGTIESGYSTIPVDPVRVTAKPACRLLVPPNQYFTDTLTVGVIALANDGGTLIGAIDRVRFWFEGGSSDVLAPTWHSVTDANGKRRLYFGYWTELKKPDGVSGHGHLYAEAIPSDATMQRRVIGPYQFSPQAQLHDFSVTVAPGQTEVEGINYHSISDALEYLRDVSANNGLVAVIEPLVEDILNDGLSVHTGNEGWITIEATAPVTIAKAAYTTDLEAIIELKRNRVRFRGSNITFDMQNILAVEGLNSGERWFDGCRFINSAGRYALWRGTIRPRGYIAGGSPWFTETEFVDVPDTCNLASLARGCTMTRGYGDFSGSGLCIVHNNVVSLDATDGYLVDVPALEIRYEGPEASASFRSQGTTTKTYSAFWGDNTASFVCRRTEAQFQLSNSAEYDPVASGEGYYVSDLAAWLNSLPGWNATVRDNSRIAQLLGLPEKKNIGFAQQDTKNTTLELVTVIDLHGDFFQHRVGGNEENCIVAFNTGKDMRGQNIFISGGSTPARDFIFVANAFANGLAFEGYVQHRQVLSGQASNALHSHVVIAHNSMPTQRFRLRTENGLQLDEYCLHANNTVANLLWAGEIDQSLDIENVFADAEWQETQSAATLFGGDFSSKHVDTVSGDLRPAGELLANLTLPVFAVSQMDDIVPVPVGAIV